MLHDLQVQAGVESGSDDAVAAVAADDSAVDTAFPDIISAVAAAVAAF